MPYVYVSKKADEFSDPVYHCDPDCGSVELLGGNGSYALALLLPLIMILLAAFLFLKATPPRSLGSSSPRSGQG